MFITKFIKPILATLLMVTFTLVILLIGLTDALRYTTQADTATVLFGFVLFSVECLVWLISGIEWLRYISSFSVSSKIS